ncbi:hypothetical protein [Kitasatospora viridis]|uniref:Uncharacterized protein n=1 Tax=Kitasatospora viridis TaxID=281105 RepID=A0A561SA90_9ACTN|nr:hypothetical protein [Kitasatospora viridis]TWF71790.1 hypothetical protein FHX73_18161 [Kitasatospora viridis]
MTANTPSFSFRTGGHAASAAEDEARKAAQSRRSNGPEYFGIEDGESIILRMLTDDPELIWVDQHSFVPTKAAPEGVDNWPRSMTAVCRKDEALASHFDGCYICDNKLRNNFGHLATPQIRAWAFAVERELVKGDGSEALGGPSKLGVIVGIRDKTVQVEETGEDGQPTGAVHRFPKIIVINQPMKTFFAHFRQMYGLHKTVCDRDYKVSREGTGKDTAYQVSSLDPVPDLKPGTPAWDRYLQTLDTRSFNLAAIIGEKASDAYYARFFDPRFELDKDGNVVATGQGGNALTDLGASPAKPRMSGDLRAKIRGMGSPSSAPQHPASEIDEPPY